MHIRLPQAKARKCNISVNTNFTYLVLCKHAMTVCVITTRPTVTLELVQEKTQKQGGGITVHKNTQDSHMTTLVHTLITESRDNTEAEKCRR